MPTVVNPLTIQQSAAALQQAEVAQGRVLRGDSELEDLGAGTDPDFVNTLEHFQGMTHQEMYQAVHGPGGMDVAGLRTLQRVWFESCSEISNLTTFNQMAVTRIFGNGLWDGAGGDAARVASEKFTQVANQVARVFDSVANRLDSLAWTAEAVRTAVQPPPLQATTSPDPDNVEESLLPGLVNPAFEDQSRLAQEEARQAVISTLETVYKPAFPPAGTGVPTFAEVPQIGGSGNPTEVPGGTPPSGPGPGTDVPAPDQNRPEGPTPTPEQPTTPAALDDDGSQSNPSTAPGDRSSTTPTNGSDDTSTTSAAANSAPAVPGAPGPLNSGPGASPGGPGPGVPGVPGPGYPTGGLPGSGVGNTGGLSGSAAAGLSRGAHGVPMGPMAPGATGRRRDDQGDDEHHSPDYLRRVHDDWLAGAITPPGTIGADYGFSTDYDTEIENPPTAFTRMPPPAPAPSVGVDHNDPTEQSRTLQPSAPPPPPATHDTATQLASTIAPTAPMGAPQRSDLEPVTGEPSSEKDSDAEMESEEDAEFFTFEGVGPVMDDSPSEGNG